ncbi:hypothetical protein APUTEX25_000991 [Auxenochlorella protothecoides]|uniref:Uncharacterized protein n=1 Tax=Auxenochlorella protothecoides TaxID=3075 RepID=A0A3M7KU40_AUXPR|nr:hypothetical protein APUTEX25_000991 [Auxenochlorella protothecoides]|eukprot:RMZ52872.1 hypothetical protein APUTEX25_000991 [Auxenochlorella protothecoides]
MARLQAQIDVLSSMPQTGEGGWGGAGLNDSLPIHPSFRQSVRLPEPFLFVGVLSTGGSRGRRNAVRATWMATAPPEVMVKFVLYEEERSARIREEAAEYGDMVFVPSRGQIDYRSIVVKVWSMVEWVVAHTNPNFIMKTDDDAYIDCPALVKDLRSRCQNADCRNERLYWGEEKRKGEVIVTSGNKWSNEEYWKYTGLKEYFPYMFGGGYLTALKTMPNEDATFGFWVNGLNLARVDHPLVMASAGTCCLEEADLGGDPHATRGYHWLARQPWRGDGGALLVQRTRSTPAISLPGQGLHIEVLHLDAARLTTRMHSSLNASTLASTTAWGWRRGAYAHWLGPDVVAYAAWACGLQEPCTEIRALGDESRRTTLQRPLVAVSRDGTLGLCVSLTRLEAAAPGFGVARAEPGTRFGALAADGLWIQRLDGAEAAPPPRLLLSYERLLAAAQETRRRAAAPAPAPGIEPGSGSGRAKHRGSPDRAFTFTANATGGDLWAVPGLPEERAAALAEGESGVLAACFHSSVFLIQVEGRSARPLALPAPLAAVAGNVTHCAFAPGRGDTLAVELSRSGWAGPARHVAVWNLATGDVFPAAKYEDASWPGPHHLLTDLVPAWSPDGHTLALSTSGLWDQGCQAVLQDVSPAQAWAGGGLGEEEPWPGRARQSAAPTLLPGPGALAPAGAAGPAEALPSEGRAAGAASEAALPDVRVLLDVTGGRLSGLAHLRRAGADLAAWSLHAVVVLEETAAAGDARSAGDMKSTGDAAMAGDAAAASVGSSQATAASAAPGGAPPHLRMHFWQSSTAGTTPPQAGPVLASASLPAIKDALLGSQATGGAGGWRGAGWRGPWADLRAWVGWGASADAAPWRPEWALGAGAGAEEDPAAAELAAFISGRLADCAWERGPGSVVLALALPANLHYAVLQRLALDGSLHLLARVLVVWPVDVLTWHQAQAWEGVLGTVHLPWEYLSPGDAPAAERQRRGWDGAARE